MQIFQSCENICSNISLRCSYPVIIQYIISTCLNISCWTCIKTRLKSIEIPNSRIRDINRFPIRIKLSCRYSTNSLKTLPSYLNTWPSAISASISICRAGVAPTVTFHAPSHHIILVHSCWTFLYTSKSSMEKQAWIACQTHRLETCEGSYNCWLKFTWLATKWTFNTQTIVIHISIST